VATAASVPQDGAVGVDELRLAIEVLGGKPTPEEMQQLM
jgi:hypothetical protein